MCGLTGIWLSQERPETATLLRLVAPMTKALFHRGPDDSGEWVDAEVGVAIGHRRLAVLDLSSAGHQPMASKSNRFIIAYNGEIYNHNSIRSELIAEGFLPVWRGHSDTETLLVAIEAWGLNVTLKKCVGMFAIALWDKKNRTLQLARDRLGEKPLYYGWVDGAFIFGSELKSLRAYARFDAPICREALAQYLRYLYVPSPRSIYKRIYKLEPGCILKIAEAPIEAPLQKPLKPGETVGNLSLSRWFSLADSTQLHVKEVNEPGTSEKEIINQLDAVLAESVQQQSLADVPLGAFLSGGVDSSTIVSLMQKQSIRPVKTFTIGFDEAEFNEAPYAQKVAKYLGTEHHEIRVTSRMAQEVIPSLPWIYDEPFADSSQIPTYLVCQSARQHVTVALSGDGGDELFGGYNRYVWAPRIWNRLSPLPFSARKLLSKGLSAIPVNKLSSIGTPFVGGSNGILRLGEKVHKLANCLYDANDIDSMYRNLVSEWVDPANLVIGENGESVVEPLGTIEENISFLNLEQPLPMMFKDTMTYLPDDILCKVDRAAMACSLETRVPFLSHRVLEKAWQLPLEMKIRDGTGKWALKQVLYKYVPKELIERPKTGFSIPLGQWLRGPLREWAEVLINEKRLLLEGYFKPTPIRKVWAEHLSGRRDHTAKLWSVLMFQAWLEKNS